MVLVFLLMACFLFAQPSQVDQALQWIADGRYAQARDLVATLIREGVETGAPRDYRAGLQHLSALIANSLSRYDEAHREAERGLALLEAAGGPSPTAARISVSLLASAAEAYTALGRYDKAEASLLRARDTARSGLPAGDPRLAAVEDGFGNLWLARRQPRKAEQSFRAAFELLESRLGPDHPDLTAPALMLASLLDARGNSAEAIALLRRSIQILERTRGPSHPTTLAAWTRLGFSHIESNAAEAERILRTTLDTWLAAHAERQVIVAAILSGLAASRQRQSDVYGAAEFGARCLAVLRDCMGPEHPQVVAAMFDQSRLLRAARKKKEAAVLEAAAERIRKDRGYVDMDRHTVDIRALIPR